MNPLWSKRGAERANPVLGLLLCAVLGFVSACGARADDGAAPKDAVLPITEVNWENDVTIEALGGSVHAELACASCHRTQSFSGDLQCRGCHDKAETVYDESVHGRARDAGKASAARCQDCHGAHDVYATSDARSRVSKRRVAATCSKCHDNPQYSKAIAQGEPGRVRHYVESIHGDRLVKKGTVVAPSCVDCHGGHEIAAKSHATSKVGRANVADTCGSCHEGVARTYAASAHGKALAAGEAEAPDCTSCHSAHSIQAPASSFKLASDRQCGKCHQERLAQHLGTYHGRAHDLGATQVAACFDCHGSHDVLESHDPASKLAPARRIETCRTCHEDAPPKMAAYLAHGDSSDRSSYPLLFWTERPIRLLMLAAVGLFALHTLLWLVRSAVAFVQSPRDYWQSVRRTQSPRPFRAVDRFAYALLLPSFAILVATGMPLELHQTAWAHRVFALLGGADVARALHQLGATMTFTAVLVHLASVIAPVWRDRAELVGASGRLELGKALRYAFRADSPLLGPADLKELWQHVRWFLGRGPEPQSRRFRYWEKLDYLALLCGIAVIGASGLAMWVPELVTRLLPGWVINVAQAVHGQEALLVVVFLFVVHVVHLLPRRWAARRKRAAGPAPLASGVVVTR